MNEGPKKERIIFQASVSGVMLVSGRALAFAKFHIPALVALFLFLSTSQSGE